MSALNLAWLTQSGAGGVLRELALLPQVLNCLRAVRDSTTPPADWADALKTLISAADAGTVPAGSGIGAADWQALLTEWATLKSKVQGTLPDALRPLSYKLSDLIGATVNGSPVPGLVSYPLSAGTTANGAATLGGLAFTTTTSANASAAVDFQVYDSTPDWAAAVGYVKPDAECLVRLGVHGQLTASASANAAPVWGSVGLSAGADASAALDYCFHVPASRYVAQVLINSVPEMFAPGDLDGALKACTQASDFAMVVGEIAGDLKLGGQVGVGYGWGIVSAKVGTDGTPIGLEAQVGIKAGFDWAVSGSYRTVVECVGSIALLRIERSTHNSTSTSISLNAEIDISGLQAGLTPLLNQILPSSQDFTDRLGALTDIRGLALKAISKQLKIDGTGKWDDVATAVLEANLAGSADEPAAVAAIASALSDKFDALGKAYLGKVDAESAAATQAIKASVQATLGGGALASAVAKLIDDVGSAVGTEIGKAYDKFATEANLAIDKVAKVLVLPSATVGNALSAAQTNLTAFTKPLVQWINRYEALRTRIANAIAKVQQQKLALAWAHAYQRDSDRTTIVEVKFSAATAASRKLFAEMSAGRLGNYAALRDACLHDNSAAESQWLMTDVLKRTETDSLTFDFFGLISTSATITAMDQVSISVDSAGRIVAASDSASVSAALTARNRQTQASIDLELQMLALNAPPPLSCTFSASGETFTLQNEIDFFGLLTDAGAVGSDVASNVRRLLWSGTSSGAATLTNAELSVLFIPDTAGWGRLLAVSPADLQVAVRKRCLGLLALAMKRNDEGPVMSGPPASWVQEWMGSTEISETRFWEIAGGVTWSDSYDQLATLAEFPTSSGSGNPSGPAQNSVKKLWQIQHLSQGVHDAWLNMQQVNSLFAQVQARTPGLNTATVSKQLSDCSDRIRTGLAQVFTGELADTGKPTKVNWQFLSLIMTLSDIANAGAPCELVTKAKATIGGADVGYVVI